MAIFRGAVLVCQICGGSFKVPPSRAETATTCSHACAVKYKAQKLMREKVPLMCKACGVTYFAHRSQSVNRTYCSYACKDSHHEYRASMSERVRGADNGNWCGGESTHSDGYIYETCAGHPFSHHNYVLQHRLVVERYLVSTNPFSKCLVQIGDNLYLNPELVVHHKDFNRTNNDIDNLQVMSLGDHQRLHQQLLRNARTNQKEITNA